MLSWEIIIFPYLFRLLEHNATKMTILKRLQHPNITRQLSQLLLNQVNDSKAGTASTRKWQVISAFHRDMYCPISGSALPLAAGGRWRGGGAGRGYQSPRSRRWPHHHSIELRKCLQWRLGSSCSLKNGFDVKSTWSGQVSVNWLEGRSLVLFDCRLHSKCFI